MFFHFHMYNGSNTLAIHYSFTCIFTDKLIQVCQKLKRKSFFITFQQFDICIFYFSYTHIQCIYWLISNLPNFKEILKFFKPNLVERNNKADESIHTQKVVNKRHIKLSAFQTDSIGFTDKTQQARSTRPHRAPKQAP